MPVRKNWVWNLTHVSSRFVTTLVLNLRSYGLHNVPRTGGVLLVSNHQSVLDPVLLTMHLRRPLSYLAKSELFQETSFWKRLFAWYLRKLNAFPVRQGEADVSAIKETIRRLKDGEMLNIFPEGSRSYTGEILPILPGVTTVIKRAGVTVVPAVVEGSHRAWPRGKRLFQFYPVDVMYGPPLKVEGLSREEVLSLIDRTLRRMQKDLKEIRRRRLTGDPIHIAALKANGR